MTKLTTESLTEVLRRLVDEAPLRTGAIPDSMVYWTAGSHAMPWANVSSNTWEIEVNFD